MPTSAPAASVTRSFHVPLISFPLKAESGESGLKVPSKGALPAEMAVPAESSKMVYCREPIGRAGAQIITAAAAPVGERDRSVIGSDKFED